MSSEGKLISRFATISVCTLCRPDDPTIDFIASSRTTELQTKVEKLEDVVFSVEDVYRINEDEDESET